MAAPVPGKKRTGTWAASHYIYKGYSDGSHPPDETWEVIRPDRNWNTFPGSNELYAFRASCSYAPKLDAQFVPCYCTQLEGNDTCVHTHITHACAKSTMMHEKEVTAVTAGPTGAEDGDRGAE